MLVESRQLSQPVLPRSPQSLLPQERVSVTVVFHREKFDRLFRTCEDVSRHNGNSHHFATFAEQRDLNSDLLLIRLPKSH